MRLQSLHCFSFSFQAMGSPCDIQLYANHQQQAEAIAQQAINDVQRLEKKYSRFLPDSYLSEINRVAESGQSIDVDEETSGLLDYAATCYEQSDGLFDITSGSLRKIWRFKDEGQITTPSEDEIACVLERIGWEKLTWKKSTLSFQQKGMELDFGGIVKEYAVDRAATICLEAGAEHGLVDLGGDIHVFGPKPQGKPWQIGIRHPRNPQAILSQFSLHHGAVASSGDYERCLTINNKRYGHIINPRTGWPVRSLASVSVVADQCVVAGSIATIALLKETSGVNWLTELDLPHVWMDVNGKAGHNL